MSKQAKFNRAEVIEKATNLYWEKGFHGTSMRNLQDVVDLRPGSIYSSFGSKENLFKEAIQHYAELGTTQLQQFLQDSTSPLNALKTFVRNSVIKTNEQSPNGMCMLVKTIAELTDEHQELLDEAKNKLSVMEREFAKIIQLAIDEGEIDASHSPEKIARQIQVQIIGLRTYLRSSNNLPAVSEMIDDLFSTIVNCKNTKS